tara:strand:+ start:953 stop:1147 length:195 start_codon:yes stop_codon:yes gene_type:complete
MGFWMECMKKNFDQIFSTIEIDRVTGEYYTIIPEQLMNEFGWYEDTELKWTVDSDEIIIQERED